MNVEQFMKAIGLSERHIATVKAIPRTEAELHALPHSALLNKAHDGDAPDKVLALFVRYLAAYSEEAYEKRGVTREEWLDTMRDVAIWSNFLQEERGEIGLRETHWLSHLIKTEIFRLGRLQFVPRISEEPVFIGKRSFPVGTPYCEVHIPADGKLSPTAVDASFARARGLLTPAYFSCDSWLLSPKLNGILSGGNILAFAARFTVMQTDGCDRSAERYIFGTIGNPHEYVAANPFAAKVKEMACRGEFVGSALGYLLI